jgi:hypothetical protein
MQQTSGQQGFDAAYVDLQTGAAVGGSTNTARITVQHSPDNSTWSSLLDPQTGAQYVSAAIDANLNVGIDVDLSAAYRYVRFNVDVTIGGTSLACACAAILMGPKVAPA